MRVRRSWTARTTSRPRSDDQAAAAVMLGLRTPVEAMLTQALRRLARRRAAAFERLGAYRCATYRITPTDLPVAFDLMPGLRDGTVRVVPRNAPGTPVARMAAPMVDLLALFDGSLDADAAFFHRTVHVEGDVAAVMALHNALEAADLRLADLAPLPFGRDLANRLFEGLLRRARRRDAPARA